MSTFTSNFSSGWASLSVTVTTESYSIANNTSYLKCVLSITKLSSCWSYNLGGANVSMTINGTTLYSSNTIDLRNLDVGSTQTVATKYITVSHNADGNKSVACSGYAESGVGLGTASVSGTFTCTSIPRQANISAAPNFNDEENPSITYSNPAGNNVTSLDACISLTGAKDDIPYRAISKTGTSYTFELTEAERNTLTDANSRTVKFYIRTVIGENTLYSIVSKTLSIVNANPTITASAKDTKESSLALTGDESKIIKGFNAVYVSMSATAYKGATITNSYITNNGKTYDMVAGTINNVENGSFTYYAQDSRGNTVTKTVTLTMLDYINLTSNLSAEMTVDGVISGNVKGNYFNSSFGSVSNTLAIEYRYKVLYGSYGSWTATTATKSGNTYSADIRITGLDYKSKYVLQARATDKLNTKNSNEITLACLPVFDWSETDFNFNVPIYIQGNPLVDLIYPVGSIYMSVNNTNPGLLIGGDWEEWGKGCVPVGVDENDTNFSTVEKTGGEKTHVLSLEEMPMHQHYLGGHTFSWGNVSGMNVGVPNAIAVAQTSANNNYLVTKQNSWNYSNFMGSGYAHNNLQPYITCYMWKRVA